MLTLKIACHCRHPTPPPFEPPSTQNHSGTSHQNQRSSKNRTGALGRHVVGSEQHNKTWLEAMSDRMQIIDRRPAAKRDHVHKEKIVSWPDIVVGIFYLLLECVYLLLEYVYLLLECVRWLLVYVVLASIIATIATWCVICVVICLFLGARSSAKEADGGTSPCGGREPAARPSAAPLAEACGGGWSELYEKLDARAAKLKEKTQSSKDDEGHNRSHNGHVVQDAETPIDETGIAGQRRRKESAMNNYMNFIS